MFHMNFCERLPCFVFIPPLQPKSCAERWDRRLQWCFCGCCVSAEYANLYDADVMPFSSDEERLSRLHKSSSPPHYPINMTGEIINVSEW